MLKAYDDDGFVVLVTKPGQNLEAKRNPKKKIGRINLYPIEAPQSGALVGAASDVFVVPTDDACQCPYGIDRRTKSWEKKVWDEYGHKINWGRGGSDFKQLKDPALNHITAVIIRVQQMVKSCGKIVKKTGSLARECSTAPIECPLKFDRTYMVIQKWRELERTLNILLKWVSSRKQLHWVVEVDEPDPKLKYVVKCIVVYNDYSATSVVGDVNQLTGLLDLREHLKNGVFLLKMWRHGYGQ